MVYCIEMVIWCYLNRENDDKAWNLGVFYFVTVPFGGEDFCSHHWCRLGLERDLASYSTIMSAVRHKEWLVQKADQETLVGGLEHGFTNPEDPCMEYLPTLTPKVI